MSKDTKKKNIKVRDLKPRKDAKGGGFTKPQGTTSPQGTTKPSGSTSPQGTTHIS